MAEEVGEPGDGREKAEGRGKEDDGGMKEGDC